jgi:hypothetical protein
MKNLLFRALGFMATTTPVTNYPWQPKSTNTGNLAIKNLREGLMKALRTERGIHAETCLAAIGAVAGFAAQAAALNRITSQEWDPTHPPSSIAIAQSKSGESFLFGDAINVYLFQEPQSQLPLIALVGGAAVQSGVPSNELPDCQEMAAHVARVVGSDNFGKVRAPNDHAPHQQPLELLRRIWPLTQAVLRLAPSKRFLRAAEKPLQEIHWPIVVGVVASELLFLTRKSLDPRIGAALIMESAIITSKIDPEAIEPGKWKIAIGEGTEPVVTRLRD